MTLSHCGSLQSVRPSQLLSKPSPQTSVDEGQTHTLSLHFLPLVQPLSSQHSGAPQSEGQLHLFSGLTHWPLPHGHGQSPGQVPQVSPQSQIALPQLGPHSPHAGAPQSPGAVHLVSLQLHLPSLAPMPHSPQAG